MKRTIYSIRHGADDKGCDVVPTWCFSMLAVQPYHLTEMLSGVLRREVKYCSRTSKLFWSYKRNVHQVTVESMEGSL